MRTRLSRGQGKVARRDQRSNKIRKSFYHPRVESLEERWVFSHSGLLVNSDFTVDPALENIQSQPPGESTGPTPVGFASYSTLANGMPVLNSLLSAPTAIYLDFDGDNSLSNPYGDRTVSPYSEDSDGTTFNLSEQRNIYEAWREVSSYFAMFDINVTTIMPAAAVPKAWLAVGNNISGGYSYVNVFPNSEPESWNQSGDARTRVSGLAHELGHNFGLQHQATYDQWGVRTAEYASATDPLHGSIMGVDYSGTIHKFIIGHNSTSSGVTTLQDDIAVIANKIKAYQPAGGDGFRADDFGNTIATASALPVAGAAQWTSAIIERLSDVDAFSFNSEGGFVAIAAAPDAPSGVDLKLDVYANDGTLVATSDGVNNVQQLTLDLAAGTYYALVSSHLNYGDVGRYFVSVSSLPSGWTSTDVGVGVSGYTVFDSATGKFNPVGTGTGLASSADGFQYAYQTLNGDGSIIARVTNVDNTSANALAGVTIRESTASNAKHVSVGKTSGGSLRMNSRSTTGGGTSTTTASSALNGHTWVRVVRAGNTFTTATSADGVAWTTLGTASVTMASSVTVGILTASANIHAMNVGQLENVAVTGSLGNAAPVYNSLAAPENPAVTLGTGSGLNLSWTSVVGAASYAVDRSVDGVNFTQVGTTTSTSYSDANLAGSARYFYRVSATDTFGRSVPSTVVHTVNRPSAVTGLGIVSPSVNQLVLNWRETTGETGYRIQRSADGGATYTTIATVGANVPSYTDSGLTSGTTYRYIVTPTSALGDGVASGAVSGGPRLAAVNPTLGTVVAGSITINWSDLTNETGYTIERSTNGTTFTTLTTVPANTTSYADTSVASGGEYYYRVFGTTAVTKSMTGGVKFAAAPSTSTPPAPWVSQDIGGIAGPGTTDLIGDTFKLVSSGNDVAGTSDSFRFTSQALSGDGEIVARVATIENSGANAKVGVMIRQSTAANSAHAFVYVTPTAIGFSYRGTAGGSTTASTVTGTAPQWVKLARSGNIFTASYSSDGLNWTQIGSSTTINMTGTAAIGLAATANSTTVLNSSTLTNVNVTFPTIPTLAISDVSQAEGSSGNTNFSFTVSLSAAASQPVTVNFQTSDGTAIAGSDYLSSSGVLTFAPGEVSKTILVAVLGDTDVEASETFTVNLSDAAGATISDAQGQGTIVNDDTTATLAISDVSQAEGNSGSTNFVFNVSLSTASTQAVTVNFQTADGTAIAGSDYLSSSGVLTFAPGEVSKTITVAVVGDTTVEANETFVVNLSSAVGATISDGQGQGTIANDDVAPPSITISDVAANEGSKGSKSFNFTVTLSRTAPTGGVAITYATANGTATAGSDYTARTGTLTIAAGQISGTISVTVTGDRTREADETFFVNLLSATNGAVIADGQGLGTIRNDDKGGTAGGRAATAPGIIAQNDGEQPAARQRETSTVTGSTSSATAQSTLVADSTDAVFSEADYDLFAADFSGLYDDVTTLKKKVLL